MIKAAQKAIDTRSILQSLFAEGFLGEPISHIMGEDAIVALEKALLFHSVDPKISRGWAKWPDSRKLLAYQQIMLKKLLLYQGKIDGIYGPATDFGIEKWQDKTRDELEPLAPKLVPPNPSTSKTRVWPTQREVPDFYGKVGQNQTMVQTPYPLRVYDTTKLITSISLHRKVAWSAMRVLARVKEYYGHEKIDEMHLNRYFGSLNVRPMKGGRGQYSMHSWGIAIDFDANRNQFRWGRNLAAFARPEYLKWWQFWEEEGWVSLGRQRNFDWMHVQAARLK